MLLKLKVLGEGGNNTTFCEEKEVLAPHPSPPSPSANRCEEDPSSYHPVTLKG
jgi:hypothetical protein